MKLKMKRFLGILLSLTLMLGLMPGMSLTAYAAPTETLLTTITATAKEQASYSTEGVATVSFSYTTNGSSAYMNNGTTNWGWWGYGWTATVTPADGYTITKCVFYDDANRKATDSEAPFVVETTEEDKTPKVNGTPILANQSKGITKIEVYGYATPATVDPVPYMAWNGSTLEEKDGDNACKTYTVVTVDTTAFEDGKWYVVSDNVTVSSRITVTGTAHLILCDGATLTASKGITVNNGNTINIYAQSGGTGELSAGNDVNTAGIGGGARYQSGGTINIHGGKITANGGSYSSGIGGALDGGNGEVNIYSGEVTAQGQNFAAGIGGYSGKSGGTVNIYGGIVNASGSKYGTTGIGIGGTEPGSCVVHIYGGEVTATSEKAAAGIQGTVTIDGGTVTANGGGDSNLIDCYSGETYSSNGISGTVTINGGTVSATGGNVTGEITNFGGNIYACNGIGGTVTINGGTVTATGGSHTGNFENHRGTTVKEKGFGGSLTLGTGMYLYGGTSANPESNLSNYRAGAGDYTGDRYVYMTVNNVVPHIHSFTYTADGATVTATCGAEGCDLTSNPTLTIVAPTLTTYGQTGEGISEKATLDGLDAFNSATDLTVAASDIKYYGVEEYEIEGHTYKKQGDELAQVPTAAGEYVAGLTLSNVKTSETETGDVIARVWYTIAPASISSVTVTDITAPVATEALDTEAATSTANVTLGAVTWNPTTTPAAYATQYTATVIATAAANYAFADTVTATVNGQAATVTKNDGGTLTIAYTFEKTALTPVTITATDKKADWSADGIAIPVEGMFTITEGAGAATYTVTNGTGEGTYDAQTGKLTVTKCGTFTVKVSTAATDTYAAGAETTATLTVNKVDSTAATVTANTLIYTGSAQALVTVTGEATGGTMQYALGTKDAATEEYTPSIPTGTDAGTYYVWYRVKGDSNHNDVAAASVTVTINKKLLTITAGAKSKVYGEKDPELTYDSTGLVEGDNITGSLTRDAGENAGTYAITQGTVTASDNYELSYVPALLTITKADSNTTAPTANELNYSGSAQELVTAGTPTGGTLVYSTDGESYNEMIPTGINAGEYTVYYKVIGDANHNDKVVQQVTVTILARTLDIKADEKSKTYGEDDPALTYTSEGLVEGDSITGALSRAEGENVGTYAIEQGTLTAGDNYIITYTGANLAITEAASSVTTEPVTKMPTYNGGKQTLVAGGEVAGGTMQYALGTDAEIAPTEGWSTSIPAETDAGTYYVWYRAVGDNNHSDVEATCVSVDIEKAAITITADDKSSQKGAELQELSWQVSGDYVSGDELGISASTTADSSADAGVYPITVSWNDNANYEATLISGKYTITAPEESGRVETKTIVADNVPSCSISNLTTELARSLATEEELIRVQNGENLLIYLDMENIDDSVSATDKSLVEAAVKASSKDAKVGMYLDLTLYKKVGDGAATKVTDTKESRISVTIEVPDSLKGGSDVTRTFYIIRVHDGATDILATTTETTITFETDKFSTYALAYSDKSNGSPSVTTPAQQEKAPKTGDNFPSVWLWALILAGGLVPVGYAGGRHKGLERK